MHSSFVASRAIIFVVASSSVFFSFTGTRADTVSFNRDIRPILSENCFVCHGPDATKQEGGLRLDIRELAIAEADSGEAAIVPGNVDESPLVVRITSGDAFERMPPPDSGKRLTEKQIGLMRQWIVEGAVYDGHWAFAAPERPAPPPGSPWTRGAIDQFILARLDQAGLHPSHQARRETLIRRLTLDLTGIPPTAKEVQTFLSDTSAAAYENLVDRLLMSPRYGERMAIRWLDLARYADSNGFQSDGSRDLWAWREWLVDALNRNLPFDQFTVEQLAGDLIPDASRDQIIATGFNRNHRLNGEGGRIVDEWFVETVIDRVETTGLTWLGLTFNCCRCHDHKYDPISQKEFYQLFAFFNSVDETGVLAPAGKNGENTPPLLGLPTPDQQTRLADLRQQATDTESLMNDLTVGLPARLAQWERQKGANDDVGQSQWTVLNESVAVSEGGADFQRLGDDSLLVTGKNPGHDNYRITASVGLESFSGLMLELIPDDRLANKGYGRGGNGNIVLTTLTVAIESGDEENVVPIEFVRSQANYEQQGWTAESLRTGKPTELGGQSRQGWAIDGHLAAKRATRRLVLSCREPIALPVAAKLRIEMKHASPYAGHNIGRFRLSVSDAAPDSLSAETSEFPDAIARTLATATDARSEKQSAELLAYFRDNFDEPMGNARKKQESIQQSIAEVEEGIVTTMVMREGVVRDAFVLTRGEYDKPGEKVQRGLPAILPPMPADQPMNRYGLARWIVDPSNPLTARVWVNRAWEHFFGVGLVKTSENLGSQAEFPSHPELLDWLASEFMQPTVLPPVAGQAAVNWDMKAIHKAIVMSATYRQSSHVTPKLLERDPENRLLTRGPRFRLTGELIRDSALAVSGLLTERIGGPSVRPYMPPGVWDETSKYGNLRNYKADEGEGLYRRTMYTIWKRTAAPPTMLLFDAPNREVCTVKRSRTNTPLQALSLLNEITFVEAARGLAARMLIEGGDDADQRIRFAYQNLFAREPDANERLVLRAGLEADLKYFVEHPQAATELLSVGRWKPKSDIDASEWSAYTMTANVLLNLDEFVTRE